MADEDLKLNEAEREPAAVLHDLDGRLHFNPGETSGWSFRRPTIANFETTTGIASILDLNGGQPA